MKHALCSSNLSYWYSYQRASGNLYSGSRSLAQILIIYYRLVLALYLVVVSCLVLLMMLNVYEKFQLGYDKLLDIVSLAARSYQFYMESFLFVVQYSIVLSEKSR